MSSPLLQDSPPSPDVAPDTGAPTAFRPYASPRHTPTRARYITSNDPRGYLPVYEYFVRGHWFMVDADTGYVLWTGIWKALGNAKADIVKMLDAQPELAPQLRRVRGGYLKIQGTWIHYETALRLARRVAWPIREDLVPIFGPTFPSTCLAPDQPGYGQLSPAPVRRRTRLRRGLAAPSAPHTATPLPDPIAPSPRYTPYPLPPRLPPISALTCTPPTSSDVLRRLRRNDDADMTHY